MKAKQGDKKARKQCSAEFKEQALKRAEKDGVAAAARDNVARNWRRPVHNWKQALNQFSILFGERPGV